jgi:hypothetical protein
MSQGLVLIDSSVFCLLGEEGKRRIKRKKGEVARGFFPRAGARHALLAVLGGIFSAVRCN